jgi:hypothetical protein
MTAQTTVLGPGTFKVGATGSSIDASCLVNNITITHDKNETDSTTKLCGDVRPGTTTYTFKITGNVDTDIADDAGLFALSQSAKGTQQDFEFTPETSAVTKAAGKLVIDPLDFGAGDMGADLTSDFEWTIIGDPLYTYGP